MKKVVVSLAVLTIGFLTQADNLSNAQPSNTQAVMQQNVPQSVPNLEKIIPDPVDVNNQAEVEALDDPSLPPMARTPDAGQLSGSAEANLINSGGASFYDINQQVDSDIASTNNAVNSSNPDMDNASQVSKELGQKDINALSVPANNENVSSSLPY